MNIILTRPFCSLAKLNTPYFCRYPFAQCDYNCNTATFSSPERKSSRYHNTAVSSSNFDSWLIIGKYRNRGWLRVTNRNESDSMKESRVERHPIVVVVIAVAAGTVDGRGCKERNNESPCRESALFIDNKASGRATRRCDEGKYSASISVRGCLSILDEYKVLRFHPTPSPSRRNKFALARVKRGESPRSAGGSGSARGRAEGEGEGGETGAARGCATAESEGGKKGEGRVRERKWKRRTGRGVGKAGRATPDCDGNFRNYLPTSSARHFLPPSRTFPPLIRSPPSLHPLLPLPATAANAIEYQRQSAWRRENGVVRT